MWNARGKPVDLSLHGEARLEQRGIPPRLVIEVIEAPDFHTRKWFFTPEPKERHVAERDFRGRRLRVVYDEDDVEIIVITAYWRGPSTKK
jgi:hypothetical protein